MRRSAWQLVVWGLVLAGLLTVPSGARAQSPSISASMGGSYGCSNCHTLDIAVHDFQTGTYTYECHDNSGPGGADTVFFSHAVAVNDPNQSTWPGVFCDDNAPYVAYLVMDGVQSNSVDFSTGATSPAPGGGGAPTPSPTPTPAPGPAPKPPGPPHHCPVFKTSESGPGGVKVHASVSFRASDVCHGRHVKAAYVRIFRTCFPKYDSGRVYTATAKSPSDSKRYSVSKSAYDSLKPHCNTNTRYDFKYF